MSEGKKINELNTISTLTNDTVFPAVYINNGVANAAAGKISLSQVKEYIEQGVYTQEQINSLLSGKQDVLTAGTGISIQENVISSTIDSLPSQAGNSGKFLTTNGTTASWDTIPVPQNVWTTDNLVAGNNIAIQQAQQPIIDSNTLGVFHFEGNNNNAVTGASLTITPEVSGGGTLSISSAQYKFGEESTNFVCTSSSAYGTLFSSDALSFSTGQDFTIDFWAKWGNASYGAIYPFYASSSSLYGLGTYNGYFRVFNAGSQYNPSNVPAGFSLSNWNHFAIERVGGTINWYTGGAKIYTASQNSEAKVQMRILDGSTSNTIYVDELRISNVARYNGNSYTVNTQPYSYGEIKYQIDVDLTSVSGYSSSGTQVLKNINGVLTWVTES